MKTFYIGMLIAGIILLNPVEVFCSNQHMKINQISKASAGTEVVVIEGIEDLNLREGDILESIRYIGDRDSLVIKTGELKLLKSNDGIGMGVVTQYQSDEAKLYLKKFPYIMAGDFLRPKSINISANTIVSEDVAVLFEDLFSDPNSNPKNYELKSSALELLAIKLSDIALQRAQKLIIEAHTDSKGSFSENQVESLQRALVIKQLIVDKLNFDPTRIVALGLGESEQTVENNIPDSASEQRKLVFKVVNEP